MTHFEDLAPCSYFFPRNTARLRAIGWLEDGHPFRKGACSDEFLEKWKALAKDPWMPIFLMGPHACTLCASEPRARDAYYMAAVQKNGPSFEPPDMTGWTPMIPPKRRPQ